MDLARDFILLALYLLLALSATVLLVPDILARLLRRGGTAGLARAERSLDRALLPVEKKLYNQKKMRQCQGPEAALELIARELGLPDADERFRQIRKHREKDEAALHEPHDAGEGTIPRGSKESLFRKDPDLETAKAFLLLGKEFGAGPREKLLARGAVVIAWFLVVWGVVALFG